MEQDGLLVFDPRRAQIVDLIVKLASGGGQTRHEESPFIE
jgi:hypothetical protein